jgi:hypothetical protein
VTHSNNGQTPPDLLQTADVLRRERPEASPLRLDEIKRDVLQRGTRRESRTFTSLRRRLTALTLAVMLLGISTSNAAAAVLNWVSGGSFGSKTLGYGNSSKGMQFFFGSFGFGGDSSDDAGKETYCPDDDKGSDDRDGSSEDNSDGDKSSDDRDESSGDQSDDFGKDECESDDGDKSSDDQSD